MSRIARLAKFIGVVESSDTLLIKHLAGQHDQATHGNWSGHHGQAVDRKNTAEGNPYPHPVQTAYDAVVAGQEGIVSPIDAPAWLDAMADRKDNPDLTNLEILGTQYFTKDNLGIKRDKMPQIPPSTQKAFVQAMRERGVKVDLVDVTPFGLHPIQSEISATKAGKIFRDMKKNGVDETPIVVSSDDYVIDGHHRWAAGLFLGLMAKHKNIKLKALRVDMPHAQLMDVVLAWNKTVGIESVPLGVENDARFKKMLAFDIAVLKAKINSTKVDKHLAGQHDQSSHGHRFSADVAPSVVRDVLRQVAENGGLSAKLTDGSLPPDGYMVSRNSDKFGMVVKASQFFNENQGAEILGKFLIKNKSELASGRAYLGVWHETTKKVNGVTVDIPQAEQLVHLDVTDRIVNKKQAISLGRRRNQISIWDVVNFDEIQTGGTGGTVAKGSYKHSLIPETVERNDGRGNYDLGERDLREVAKTSVTLAVPVSSNLTKHLAGQHDQSSHGSWANNDAHYAGNGFSIRETMALQRGRSDPLVQKIYSAEKKYQPVLDGSATKPVAPTISDFASYDGYDSAWKQFRKDHAKWGRSLTKNLQTDLGKQYLDGSRKGIENYVRAVVNTEWFKNEFGDGKPLGFPEIKMSSAQSYAGKWEIGISQTGKTRNRISIDSYYNQAEPTIIHEIAHYATGISATQGYDGHGVEFARNHLFIIEHLVGKEQASQLKALYIQEGVPL